MSELTKEGKKKGTLKQPNTDEEDIYRSDQAERGWTKGLSKSTYQVPAMQLIGTTCIDIRNWG